MRKHNYISYRLIAISLIVVMGIHSFNSFFNTHSHRLEDGTIVVHAHPYERSSDSSPFENHHHTATELVFLASLIHFIPTIVFILVGFVQIYSKELLKGHQRLLSQHSISIPTLRGPPAHTLCAYC